MSPVKRSYRLQYFTQRVLYYFYWVLVKNIIEYPKIFWIILENFEQQNCTIVTERMKGLWYNEEYNRFRILLNFMEILKYISVKMTGINDMVLIETQIQYQN